MFFIIIVTLFAVNALANPVGVPQIVADAEQNLSKSILLEARFRQKTIMPFIDVMLESDGKFCFDISDKKLPYIFWEYQKPDVSGFFMEKGKLSFWTTQKQKIISASEMKYLRWMTNQILQWIIFDSEEILKIYNVTQTGMCTLRFEPKEKSHLFKAIALTLSDDMRKLDSLTFHGQNGEITTIAFDIEKINKPLSSACRR